MPTISHHLSPTTWSALGLYIGLGTLYILYPTFSARNVFALLPPSPSDSQAPPPPPPAPASAGETSLPLPETLSLVGIRDISIGLALLALWRAGERCAMGRVVLCGLPIAAGDAVVLLRRGRPDMVVVLLPLALVWAGIGMGLLGW